MPLSERLHIAVQAQGVESKAFWFNKSMSGGRVFDLLTQQLCLPSDTVRECDLFLIKEHESAGRSPLQYDKALSEQLEDCDCLSIEKKEVS